MSQKNPLDDLSIEELEKLLREKKRRERLQRLQRLTQGRPAPPTSSDPAAPAHPTSIPQPVALPHHRGRSERPMVTSTRTPKPSLLKSGLTRLRDRLLLLVELGALLGLIYVVLSALSELQVLNREVAEARQSATLGQPLSSVAVLPASSSPPPDYLPGPYRSLLGTSSAPVVIPTPGPRQAARIVIRAIGVDAPVVAGDGWEELKAGVGYHIGSASPGERGNLVLSAHNDVYGEIFRYLERLETGDEVIVYTQGGIPYRYIVRAKRVVEPREVSVMDATTQPTLTLITCHPYLIDTHRMVVFAELVR